MKEDKALLHGHRNRAKEKFLENFENNIESSEQDLLELLLFYSIPRKDTKMLAKQLLSHFGSLQGVINAPYNQLEEFLNLSTNTLAIFRLLQACSVTMAKRKIIATKPVFAIWTQVIDYCHQKFAYLEKEILAVFYLNKSNVLVKEEIVQEGTIDKLLIYPREIIKKAIANQSCNIVLVHNHPSGNSNPSKADIDMTRNISQALSYVEIKLVDHIIISRNGFSSLRELNLL